MYRIGILIFDSVMQSSITGPYDLFFSASAEWRQLANTEAALFKVKTVSTGHTDIRSFNGSRFKADRSIDTDEKYDILFIPVFSGDIDAVLADQRLIQWLIEQFRSGACLSAVCAGSFLLAQTGLLDGKQATTHWQLADPFQARFPRVKLKKERILIDEGNLITAGGVTAYFDLSLHLVARFGSRELANRLSRLFLIDSVRHSQLPYGRFRANKNHGDSDILRVQEWIEAHPSQTIGLSRLAEISGLEIRTLSRRFKKVTGETPIEYLQQVRVDIARERLLSSRDTIDQILYQIGYDDSSSFRKLFKRLTGLSPAAYRKQFSVFAPLD